MASPIAALPDGAAPNDVVVSSWAELNERLYEHAWREELGRFRSPFAFRGQPHAAFDLTTSLIRLGGPFQELESHLLRDFRKYVPRAEVSWPDSVWTWLAVAQHHGLPTRLLDWTYSPYVAMHFATEHLEHFDVDAAIWCVDYAGVNELLPPPLKEVVAAEGSNVLTVEMLGNASGTLADLAKLADRDFVVFLEPPSLDARIVNQFALFALMSRPDRAMHTWLAEHPGLYRRIIIPAALKWEVRDKLDQANVTERVLLPGLDGLSRWLKRYYSPKRAGRTILPGPVTGAPADAAGLAERTLTSGEVTRPAA